MTMEAVKLYSNGASVIGFVFSLLYDEEVLLYPLSLFGINYMQLGDVHFVRSV